MNEAVRAFIGLGANLGDARNTLEEALLALSALPHVELVCVSPFYRSAPVGFSPQPDFINAVSEIKTHLSPQELMRLLLSLEKLFGRRREKRWGPRVLDLDLLLYGDEIIEDEFLSLPHPRLEERAFVLLPLLSLAPEILIPGKGQASAYLPSVARQDISLCCPDGKQHS